MPDTEVPRDRYGRPLIVPPGGGKPVPYARASSFGGNLEDTTNLTKWKLRMAADGLSSRPDLMLAYTAAATDKDRNAVLEQAIEAAGGSRKAGIGTSLHALTERIDRGEDLGYVPAEWVPDLKAYEKTMQDIAVVEIERFVVQDDVKAAGTFDRLLNWDGYPMIGDVKTGSIYGAGKIAVQLAVYARASYYNPVDGSRAILNPDVATGIVIHLPQGQGICDLYEIDIAAGWEAATGLVGPVNSWRKRRTQLLRKVS